MLYVWGEKKFAKPKKNWQGSEAWLTQTCPLQQFRNCSYIHLAEGNNWCTTESTWGCIFFSKKCIFITFSVIILFEYWAMDIFLVLFCWLYYIISCFFFNVAGKKIVLILKLLNMSGFYYFTIIFIIGLLCELSPGYTINAHILLVDFRWQINCVHATIANLS